MICPYCELKITSNQIEKNDGCCPHCGTPIDHAELDELEEEELHEDDTEDFEERFGHPTRSYEQRDVFDDYLEEEEREETLRHYSGEDDY
jgi:Zn-finger nucleic acid-binding protein